MTEFGSNCVRKWFCYAGDYVAHIKFTVMLMPNGSDRITSHPLQELQPAKTIDDPEIKAWLALGIKTKKKGGGKKKKGMLAHSKFFICFPFGINHVTNSVFLFLQVRRVTRLSRRQRPSRWMGQ